MKYAPCPLNAENEQKVSAYVSLTVSGYINVRAKYRSRFPPNKHVHICLPIVNHHLFILYQYQEVRQKASGLSYAEKNIYALIPFKSVEPTELIYIVRYHVTT